MAKEWQIPREAQDQLALESHQKAALAYEKGFFADMIVPTAGWSGTTICAATPPGEASKLKPAFDKVSGTLTPPTARRHHGASAVLLPRRLGKSRGLKTLAFLTSYETAAVDFFERKEGC